MSEYQPGDRVSIEGRVLHQTSDGWPMVERLSDGALLGFIDPAHLRLIDRPAPPLPTEPGTTGTATVRGTPNVRVMRVSGIGRTWVSHRLVEDGGERWHADSDLADFVPDPQPVPAQDDTSAAPLYAPNGLKTLHEDLCRAQTAVGQFYTDDRTWGTVKRLQSLIDQIEVYRPLGSNGKHGNLHTSYCGCDADPTPATPQPAPEPPCECGHGRGDHGPGLTDCRAVKGCPCSAYRPATPEPACICTSDTSGHIVSLDPTCPATEPSTNTGKPSITTRDTNAYPTGLVERVARLS